MAAETWQLWAQIITSVGFPIAACVALYYYMLTMIKEHKEENEALRKEHKEEISALRETLESLCEAIQELKGSMRNGNVC